MPTQTKKPGKKLKPEFETAKTCELLSQLAENPDTDPIPECPRSAAVQVIKAEVKGIVQPETVPNAQAPADPVISPRKHRDRRRAPETLSEKYSDITKNAPASE